MSIIKNWLESCVSWLDGYGRSAWLTAMILGFIFFWPVGLAILFYMIWSERMSCRFFKTKTTLSKTGNSAFDKYKEDTITRLDAEQNAFQGFLQRLRDAKDQAEFDEFMKEREQAQKTA